MLLSISPLMTWASCVLCQLCPPFLALEVGGRVLISELGRATALWVLLCLSETPPADTLRATWLLQAIAAAQALQPTDLVRYLDTLHLVVQNLSLCVEISLLLFFISFCLHWF